MKRVLMSIGIVWIVISLLSLCGCDLLSSILGIASPGDGEGDDTPPLEMPTEGLVAEWLLDGTVVDTSGAGLDGTNNGATAAADARGNEDSALSFDGASFVDIPWPLSADTATFSVSLWVSPSDLSTKGLALHTSPGIGEIQLGLDGSSPNRVAFGLKLGDWGWFIITSNATLSTGAWYHLVGVYEFGVGAEIWINGVLDKSSDEPGYTMVADDMYSTYTSCIGSFSSPDNQMYWKGSIDNVRVYERALGSEDIATLFAEMGGEIGDGDDGGDPDAAGDGIVVTKPNGGQDWETDTSYTITWTSDVAAESVRINLNKSGAFNSTITESTDNDGSYSWKIPADQEESDFYTVYIKATDNSATDESDGNFSITTKPYITILEPDADDKWGTPYSKHIQWESANAGDSVKIELYYNGDLESTIVSSTDNDDDYYWDVDADHPVIVDPDTLEADYQIKIISTSNTSISDMSGYFEIWRPLFE